MHLIPGTSCLINSFPQGIPPWPSPRADCADLFGIQPLTRENSKFPPLWAVRMELASERTPHQPAVTLMLPRWLPRVGCLIPRAASAQCPGHAAHAVEIFNKMH